jgi:hypothetical protein
MVELVDEQYVYMLARFRGGVGIHTEHSSLLDISLAESTTKSSAEVS